MGEIYRKRCRRYDNEGDVHCLTFSCFQRLPLLSKPRSCQWVLDALCLGRERGQFDLWAYVVMPEHVHVVLWPHPSVAISEILKTVKQSVSKRALLWLGKNSPTFLTRIEDIQPNGKRSHRFWQRGGGYDRNLRTLSDVYEKTDYVHANPVRRNLATKAEDWPWSSCRAWKTGLDEPIAIDRNSLPTWTIPGRDPRSR